LKGGLVCTTTNKRCVCITNTNKDIARSCQLIVVYDRISFTVSHF